MLDDLHSLGEKLQGEFLLSFSHSDIEISELFKSQYQQLLNEATNNLGYKSVKFFRYSAVVTTKSSPSSPSSPGKIISMPNYWFLAAYHFTPFVRALIKYKKILTNLSDEGAPVGKEWIKQYKGSKSLPFEKEAFNTTKGLSDGDYEFLSMFLTDYDWWWGAKTVDRGDYYISPILKLGNFLAETQSAIAEISWQMAHIEEPKFTNNVNTIVKSGRIIGAQKPFEISKFIDSLIDSNLKLKDHLLYRFVSALQTKPFLILTGLAGSGKTKLAEAFSLWVTENISRPHFFKKNEIIKGVHSSYVVEDVDRLGMIVNQERSGSKTFLPFELIKIWADVITENEFDSSTGSQVIQGKVLESRIAFSKSLNSFHSPLKALALRYNDLLHSQLGRDSSSQYCMVAVGADWTNREPLLGFPNALNSGEYVKPDCGALDLILSAKQDPSRPYFLILDEMNMSHVERYFHDFLSAMESADKNIALHPETDEWKNCVVPSSVKLPENLFIIGTVNIDETTYMFSPKVLDRANVIEFRVSESEMGSFLDEAKELNMDLLRGAGASMGESFVEKARERNQHDENLKKALIPFFKGLYGVGAEFGYRTASEISRFVSICKSIAGENMTENEVIDAAIMQKLLPKVHGSRNKIEKTLVELAKLCLIGSEKEPFFKSYEAKDIRYALSYEKLGRMHKRVLSDGFTSFAEA